MRTGQTVLDLFRTIGVHVPALCDDPRLVPIGGCRLCLVEIEGQPRPATACTTIAHDGMAISTHTEQLEELRRTQLRLLARQYPPADSEAVSTNPFFRVIRAYGLEGELGGAPALS